jgi:hypothetical protein
MMSSWAVETSRSTADWGEQRVGHHGQPFVRGPVGGHDRGGLLVAFDAQLV